MQYTQSTKGNDWTARVLAIRIMRKRMARIQASEEGMVR